MSYCWNPMPNEKQIFHPFRLWEDAKAGMYRRHSECEAFHIASAIKILSDRILCRKAMEKVIESWRFASEHNLSNKHRNRRAWLGQAACCIHAGCPEYCTKQAWGMLPSRRQNRANWIATEIIKEWDESLLEEGKCQNVNLI